MSHKEIDSAKYTEELSRLMDVLIVRYHGEQGHYPSGYIRVKLRTQVVNFLAERFPGETALFRNFLKWQSDTIGGTLRSIRSEEVPAEHKIGFDINNSLRGKLSAQTRYRNTGIAAFRSDRLYAEGKKQQEIQDVLNGAGVSPDIQVQASPEAVRNALDVNIALRRYSLAIQYCVEKEAIFPSNEVCGLLMGLSPDVVAAYRSSDKDHYDFVADGNGGWWIRPLPEKTLMERVMEKLAKMDMDELAALADLIKDSD